MKKDTYNVKIICENCDYPNLIEVQKGDLAPTETNCDNCRCSTRIPLKPAEPSRPPGSLFKGDPDNWEKEKDRIF